LPKHRIKRGDKVYYFEVLNILEAKPKKKYTALELYLTMSKEHNVNMNRLRTILVKMTQSQKIKRELVMLPIKTKFSKNPDTPTYVYFI
jgi:hypothetical protein